MVATVKTDDYIEALINPSLRRLLGFKEVKISEDVVNSWPIISLKEIGTTFTLLSGQTVAIGGLTDVQEKKITTRVPFLGRIPILGRFFSHDEDVKSQVETIIFVTLSVADPERLEENAGVPEDARLVHQRRLKDEAKREEHMKAIQKQMDDRNAASATDTTAPATEEGSQEKDSSPDETATDVKAEDHVGTIIAADVPDVGEKSEASKTRKSRAKKSR